MSQKTELSPSSDQPEFAKGYLLSLGIITAFVLIFIFGIGPFFGHPLEAFKIRTGPVPWMYPWILAAGQTIANGLSEFSGNAVQPVSTTLYWSGLISLLFIGVMAPTLYLLMMTGSGMRAMPNLRRSVYLLGMIICGTFAVSILPSTYAAYAAKTSLRSAQDVQRNKDEIINDLNAIAFTVQQHAILPASLGGGSGNLTGYAIPKEMSETSHATYTAQIEGGGVTVVGTSKTSAGATVTVTIDVRGQMWGWSYTGDFQ